MRLRAPVQEKNSKKLTDMMKKSCPIFDSKMKGPDRPVDIKRNYETNRYVLVLISVHSR